MSIDNRYEFTYLVACTDGNPNGDPDMGNMPRVDPQTMRGYISDAATKRRIRNYIEAAYSGKPGMNIIIQQGTNINRHIAAAKEAAGVEACAKEKNAVHAGRKKACEMFYDVRTFGAVMSTGPNAGQVRGPVQITFGKSFDPVFPLDISITRVASAETFDGAATAAAYAEREGKAPEEKLRTMGRKQFIPFGLYEVRGFVSANLAAETGFDNEDLDALFESILNMYENDRSASKGHMAVVSPLIIFKHVGTDSDSEQRARQAKLGCAPAHKLFERLSVRLKDDVKHPRDYRDYDAKIRVSNMPAGVEIGFKASAFEPVNWGTLPEGEDWLVAE